MTRATRLGLMLLCAAPGCGGTARPTEQQVLAARAACSYGTGMKAAQTLPDTQPTGKALPIEHIILLMQENRSFDHYFSSFPGVDGAAATVTNPDSQGNAVSRYHLTNKCVPGGEHSWDVEHSNNDGGKNDLFVVNNLDDPTVMGYFDGSDLTYYYALAQEFALSDRHFSSVLGPTWPNRMFYFAGTSWGTTDNTFPANEDAKGNHYPTLLSELSAAKVSWNVYAQDRATTLIASLDSIVKYPNNYLDTKDFAADVAAGKLASVTIVEGSDQLGANSPDEDPPGDFEVGQQFIAGVIGTVMGSQFWKSSAIFLSYDENGGMYDHVNPPAACAPDELPLNNGSPVGFTQYGFRVPLTVVSPYAKRHYVSHEVTDGTSILRFVESRFDLPAMTKRDANAAPAYDMFDFDHPDFSVPTLPTPTVDPDALNGCLAKYPSS